MAIRIITFLAALCVSIQMLSQDCSIAFRINVVQPSATELQSSDISSFISNRLKPLNSNSGALGSLENSQFAILFDYDILDKQIIDGAPTKIMYDLNVTYSIVDLSSQNVFISYSHKLKGVGNNEKKALLNAFQGINPADTNLRQFLQDGKSMVVDFYNNNYPIIIKKAQSLASTRRYDEAIYNLMMIPECCIGYDQSGSVLMDIYQQFINQHCNENLAQARAAWLASPNRDGAISASVFLSEIYPDASCFDDAMKLAEEIKRKLGEDWEFEMKQWAENVALETQRINAMRDIGIAYAQSLYGPRKTSRK